MDARSESSAYQIKVHHKNNGKMTFNIGEEAVGGA
jgi:hypothetical protein